MFYGGNGNIDLSSVDWSKMASFQFSPLSPSSQPPPQQQQQQQEQQPQEENGVKYLGVTRDMLSYTGNVADKEEVRKSLMCGDKMILPEDVLISVTQSSQSMPDIFQFLSPHMRPQLSLPKVMIFEVTNESNKIKAYGGVLQFSRSCDHAFLPSWMFSRLVGGANIIEHKLRFQNVSVPNAVSIKLLPRSRSFYDIGNPKALLETILSRFTVLYKGLEFYVPSPSNSQEMLEFEVVEVSPGEVVCIVDQDVQVDFAENKEFFPENDSLKKKVDVSSTGNNNNDDNNNDDDGDIQGGFQQQRSEMQKDKGHSLSEETNAMENAGGDSDVCDNCGKHIPGPQMRLHVLRCKRIYSRCPKCNAVVEKARLDNHIKELHTQVKCERCGVTFADKEMLDAHKCPYELIPCEYCGINVVRKEFYQHAEYCGSRTDVCEVCGATVTKRDMKLHLESNCTYPQKSESPKRPSGGSSVDENDYNSGNDSDGYDYAYEQHYWDRTLPPPPPPSQQQQQPLPPPPPPPQQPQPQVFHQCSMCNKTMFDAEERECGICFKCAMKKLSVFMIDDGESVGKSYCNIYFCPICNEMFNEIQFFFEHVKTSTCFKKDGKYVCERCGLFSGNFAQLIMHFDKCVPKLQQRPRVEDYKPDTPLFNNDYDNNDDDDDDDDDEDEDNIILCPYCEKPCFGAGGLEAHKVVCPKMPRESDDKKDSSSANGGNAYICPFCNKNFDSFDELNRHVYKCEMDPDNAPAPSQEQPSERHTPQPLPEHSYIIRDDGDDNNNNSNSNSNNSGSDKPKEEEKEVKSVPKPSEEGNSTCDNVCPFCDRKFASPDELKGHVYKCEMDPENTSVKQSHESHVPQSLSTPTEAEYKKEEEEEEEEEKSVPKPSEEGNSTCDNVCPFCDRKFASPDELKGHVYKCEMDPENTPARQGYAPPSYNQPAYAPPQYNQPAYAPPQYNQSAYVTGGTHKCKFCGLSFYSEGCKNSHERCCQGCSSDYYASGSEVDDSVSTEHANGSFNKIAKIRDDLLRCDKCGKNFTKLDDYLDHKSKGCYFHCTKCGDSFESFEDLDAHNESIHTVD